MTDAAPPRRDPGAEALADAEVALGRGEVVGLPTDTVYGLAALAAAPAAAESLSALKGRAESIAIAVLVADLGQALDLALDEDGRVTLLAAHFWPGALTVVARRRPEVPLVLGGEAESIGLRCPEDDFVRELARRVGPLAVTSANLHGEAPLRSAAALRRVFPTISVADGGLRDGVPSTVLSLLGPDPEVLREGAIATAALLEVLLA